MKPYFVIKINKLVSVSEFYERIIPMENWAQDFWNKNQTHKMKINAAKEPYYVLSAFPYPSAQNLHVGHAVGYVGADVNARFERLRGKNVLQPFGFDSFGLPAEQYAIATGQHPEVTTANNIKHMIHQINELGMMIDWDREVRTSDANYYKWTQSIFLKFYEHFFDATEIWEDGFGNRIIGRAKHISILEDRLKKGEHSIDQRGYAQAIKAHKTYTQQEIDMAIDNARLAYLGEAAVNWCPRLGTVLSDEEVIEGKSERGGYPVLKVTKKQWMMRITKYADRLITGFEKLNWPESTVRMQEHWIGKSVGMEIDFEVVGSEITVYTTRPDTILGVTFIAAAPSKYPHLKLTDGVKGIFTGEYATHPITREKIPIFVADYVLDGYGTGYVMCVPAHDSRDFAFAQEMNLPIKAAICPTDEWLQSRGLSLKDYLNKPGPDLYLDKTDVITTEGPVPNEEFIKTVPGRQSKRYRLRDWIFSRQRYWGEPFPLVHCPETGKIYPIHESELPVKLPETVDFSPIETKEMTTPLDRCKEWMEVKVEIVDGKAKLRGIDPNKAQLMRMDSNTMPNWAGSCWYYLRYLDPRNEREIFSEAEYSYWATIGRQSKYALVDLYIGGSEHAVLHYLYARFWHMFLYDIGVIKNPEPFEELIHQGLISAPSYFNPERFQYVAPDDVEFLEGHYHDKANGEKLEVQQGKMGKSYKNGRECSEVVRRVGASVLRLYLMYMGPLTDPKNNWDDQAMVGMARFLRNVYNAAAESDKAPADPGNLNALIHDVTKAYTQRIQAHIMVAKLIEFLNKNTLAHSDLVVFLKLLAPVAPHFSEYLYQQLMPGKSIFDTEWPVVNIPSDALINVVMSIDGKFKKSLKVSKDLSDEEIIKLSGDHSKHYLLKRMETKIVLNFMKD